MILEIDDSKTISDLQEKFNLCYPNLKIEFYKKRHHWEDLSPENEKWDPGTLIGSIRKEHEPGFLEIKSWNKVGEIEKSFFEKFGLNVQIFFKSGKKWIQTGKSDNFIISSLHNRMNREFSILL